MIHDLLTRLHQQLPFYPPAMAAVAAVLMIALALAFFGRSRTTILFCIAAIVLNAGMAAGLFGIANPPTRAITWGQAEEIADQVLGPASFRTYEQFTIAGLVLGGILLATVYSQATRQTPGEAAKRQLSQDEAQRIALGSAHLCTAQTFRRWHRHDPYGWTVRGTFWGANRQQLGKSMCLSGEDIARGIAVFGPQGSGKTQTIILPAIADRMRDGHSLIVTDVQGELLPHIQRIAAITKHAVIVHNPSDPANSCALNLCDWIKNVAHAQAMATVLISGDGKSSEQFWNRAATNMLAACSLHYPSYGAILDARNDPHQMARDLKNSPNPAVVNLAASFFSSMESRDPRLALNILATACETTLTQWSDPSLRQITDGTNYDIAGQMIVRPTVVVLGCTLQDSKAYGVYLGAILRVLTTQLDDLGRQKPGGALPIPVSLILEEFPALGRLDSLVENINLVRKRRISVLTAAQSLAQFDHVYPGRGEADRLLAGLATKIVFGGCDQRTAEFFSDLSGQQTLTLASISRSHSQRLSHSGSTASVRGRALLMADDIVRPAQGHATIFAAYSDGTRADQAIFHSLLTPFYQRNDWKKLRKVQPKELTKPAWTPAAPLSVNSAPTEPAGDTRGQPPQPVADPSSREEDEMTQMIAVVAPEIPHE